MVSRRWTLFALALAMLGVAALGAVKLAAADSGRADCPGKIVCPETGKLICRDHCPTIDRNRPDCPGRVVCPLTGKLVCKDRCPLGDTAKKNTDTDAKPSCCRKGGRVRDASGEGWHGHADAAPAGLLSRRPYGTTAPPILSRTQGGPGSDFSLDTRHGRAIMADAMSILQRMALPRVLG